LYEPSDCPKERIILAWDQRLKKIEEMEKQNALNKNATEIDVPQLFGCYDNLCCTASYNTIASKSNYMALIAIFLFFTGLVCALGSYKVYDDLHDGDEKPPLNMENIFSSSNIVIFVLVAVVALIVIIAISTLPEKPPQDPNSLIPPNPSDKINSDISNLVVNKNLNNTVQNETKTIRDEIKNSTQINEKKDCGDRCPVLRYTFELSSSDGTFERNKTENFKNLIIKQDAKVGSYYIVRFEGGPENLEKFTQFFEFVHNCPMLPAKIYIKVKGEVNPGLRNPTSFIENKMKSKIKQAVSSDPNIVSKVDQNTTNDSINAVVSSNVIDYSKLKIGDRFEVLNKTMDFSFVSEDSQLIQGKVFKRVDLKTTIPINNAEVVIKNLDFGQCEEYTVTTDANGYFSSPKLYIFKDDLKSKFQISVKANDLTPFKKTVIAGGIGAPDVINLGNIELWSPTMLESINISSSIINSIDNTPVDGVKVSLYQGFINVDNEVSDYKPNSSNVNFIQLNENNSKDKKETVLDLLELKSNNMDNNLLFKTEVTDSKGLYEFKELSPNLYTLIFEKEGFYREVLSKY